MPRLSFEELLAELLTEHTRAIQEVQNPSRGDASVNATATTFGISAKLTGLDMIAKESIERQSISTQQQSYMTQQTDRTASACTRAKSLEETSAYEQELLGTYGTECWITTTYQLWFADVVEPKRDGFFARVVTSNYFGIVSMLIIMSNSIFHTFTSQLEMKTLSSDLPAKYRVAELCFLGFYLIEVLLRLSVHKSFFFRNEEWAWNTFDLMLVLQALLDWVVVQLGSKGKSLAVARMLRLLKLGKIFRLFRALRFLRELRVMVKSLVSSSMTMVWATIMLCLILYVFAAVIIQSMSAYLSDEVLHGTALDPNVVSEIREFLGTVPLTMLTLYQATSGGIDWVTVYDLIEPAGPFLQIVFLSFLGFFNFAVFNVLSGVFLEKAILNSEPDRNAEALVKRRRDREDATALTSLMKSMDCEGNGALSLTEFQRQLTDDKVRCYLASLGVEVRDAQLFFDMLSQISGQSDLPIEDFVQLCSGMKGNATGIDMAGVTYELKVMRREIHELMQRPDSPSGWRALRKSYPAASPSTCREKGKSSKSCSSLRLPEDTENFLAM